MRRQLAETAGGAALTGGLAAGGVALLEVFQPGASAGQAGQAVLSAGTAGAVIGTMFGFCFGQDFGRRR